MVCSDWDMRKQARCEERYFLCNLLYWLDKFNRHHTSPYKAAAKAVIALSPLPDLSTKGGEIFDDWWGKVLQIQKHEKRERISHFQVWKSRSVDANERLQLWRKSAKQENCKTAVCTVAKKFQYSAIDFQYFLLSWSGFARNVRRCQKLLLML